MDISRFHAAFFEESREGLQAMEAGLLRLESAEPDLDTINVVFRAATRSRAARRPLDSARSPT